MRVSAVRTSESLLTALARAMALPTPPPGVASDGERVLYILMCLHNKFYRFDVSVVT